MAMCSQTVEYAMSVSDLKCEVCRDEPTPHIFVTKGFPRVFNACETHESDVECITHTYAKENGSEEYGRITLNTVGTFTDGMFMEVALTEYEVE